MSAWTEIKGFIDNKYLRECEIIPPRDELYSREYMLWHAKSSTCIFMAVPDLAKILFPNL